jgi:hypothetical protein
VTFAAPLFLLAVLAAAIPVVLHMIHRRSAKDLPFPTLRFLKRSAEKTRRRRRIHDVLLMALRAAVLLLIALGLARPTIKRFGSLWGSAQTAAVVILDNSASMGLVDRDRPRLETATAAAVQILDQLGEGDQAALLPTCGPPLPDIGKLDRTQDTVRQALGQCRVSYQRADLALNLQQARDLLAKSDAPNKQIYILSDMQRASWKTGDGGRERGEERQSPKSEVPSPKSEVPSPKSPSPHPNPLPKGEGTDVPIIIVDCDRAPKPNVAVQAVDVDATIPLAGLPIKTTITLQNTSTIGQQRVVELLIDGVKQASSPELNLPPVGRAKHEFTFTVKQDGMHRGEVRLVGEDGSKYDDRRFFTLEADQGVPVAVVKARQHEIPYLDDAYYLERALGAGRREGGAIRVATIAADRLTEEPLEKYKVLFCVNLPALGSDAAERLAAYIAGGGNVVWICGDNVRPEAYNRMNEEAHGQLLPAPLLDVRTPGAKGNRDSWHIGSLDKSYPAFSRLTEPASLYESVLVTKHVRMATKEDAARVLARLDDGEPLLVERSVGRGRTLLLGTSVHVNWSNLPLRPIFLPLITQLTLGLANVEQARSSLIAGQPIVLPLPQSAAGVELVPPSGEMLRLKTETDAGKTGRTFRYANTYDIGIYLLRVLDAEQSRAIASAVNFDPDEADPAKIDAEELRGRLGDASLVLADNPDDLSATFAALREGTSLWGLFLSAVLIALVFETFLSNRFGPKPQT